MAVANTIDDDRRREAESIICVQGGEDVRHRRLGHTGLIVSEVALGSMQFGGQMNMGNLDQDETNQMVTLALDRGINFIDTADVYSLGESETLLGHALKGIRQEIVLATNFTVEGEATAHYIAEILRAKGLKVSRIARGLPVGGELEHVDSGTLAQAVMERREVL